VTGSYSQTKTSSDSYTMTETCPAYTLSESGTNQATTQETGNSLTADYSRSITGSDTYVLTESGTNTYGSYSETVTGSDAYTQTETGNTLNQTFSRSTSGTGTYTRQESGPGATQGPWSDSLSYTVQETGDWRAGLLSQSETGCDRYGLLEQFDNVSNTGSGSAPGHLNFSPVGMPFSDDPPLPAKTQDDRGLDSVEMALVGIFLRAIDDLSEDEFKAVVSRARLRIDRDLAYEKVKDMDAKAMLAAFKEDPGKLIAGLAFAGGAQAITLPPPLSNNGTCIVIVSSKSIRGTKPAATEKDAPTVDSIENLALEAHELQHVVQMVRAKKSSEFLAKYLSEYLDNRFRFKMNEEDAYELIMAEIEGHAVQKAVEKVLKDATNLKKFKQIAEIRSLFEGTDFQTQFMWEMFTKSKLSRQDIKDLGEAFKREYERVKKEKVEELEKKKKEAKEK